MAYVKEKKKPKQRHATQNKRHALNDHTDQIRKDDYRFCKTIEDSLESFEEMAMVHAIESGPFSKEKNHVAYENSAV